jgi:hypothetical protein
MGSSLIQIGQALSGAALPLAYGPCRVRGNNVLNQQLANNNRIALYILGEGPWDGIDRLWMNGKLIDLTTTTLIHFHNGFDGTLGAGLAPTSFGGDQGVDQFWSLLPSNFQPLTLSRKAYLMVQAVPDPQAPSNTLDVVADYRTMRVRIFDATGAQTAFQYSLNPAWQILDVIIREMLNREWTTAGAAAGGGDLTAAMKARISFTSFKAAADICDTVLASGAKTFEGGVAWPSLTGMQQALDTLCTLSQTYLVEQGGQITLLPDQARPSTFTLTSSHITAGSFQATKSQLRGAQNRFIGTFNDINAQKNADIDTVGNVGLSRTANVTTVVVPAGQVHGFLVGDNVDIVNPTDASFAGTITVATVPNTRTITGAQTGANTTSGGGYVGTTESRFAQRTKVIDHEQHQLAVGQRGLNLSPVYKRVPVTIDFGNNTMERVERLLNFIKTRNLGVDATPYAAPFSAKVQASFYAVDATNNVLAAQLPGDILTIDATISEEFQGDYEIMKISYARPTGEASNSQSGGADQSAQAEVLNLTLKQYLPAAFSTLSNTAQSLVASIARKGLPPAESVDGTGSLVVSLGKTVDDATTSRFAVVQIDGARRPITDFASAHLNKNTDNIADATGSPLTGGKRGFVAIDGGNVLVAGSADFSRAYTGKHLGNIPDNTASGRLAKLTFYNPLGNAASAWVKVGTWVFPVDGQGHSIHIEMVSGNGYNTNSNQQTLTDMFVRGSNGISGAPNISGATWISQGNANGVLAVKVVATGGSALQTNGSWEIWVNVGPFGDYSLHLDLEPNDTWTNSGTTGSDPGAASSTVVVGTGRNFVDSTAIVNPTGIDLARGYTGKHLGNIPDDGGSARFAVASIDAARKALIDFAQTHTNKHLGNVPDDVTSDRRAATANQKTGGDRGFSAIDSGNIVVAAGVDFARGYTNKHLGNIPDNVASARFAVASIDAARKALIDFAQTHTNKHLDNMPDGTTYSRCRGSQLQNGSPIRGGGGKNLLANPGFENNVSLTPVSTALAANADAADEWFVFGVSAFHSVSIDTVVPRGGANSLLIRLSQGVTVPNDSVLYQTRVWTKAKLAVRIGDIVRVAGYARWDNDTAVPAGVFATQRIGLAFFNAADSFLGELNADITNAAAGTGAYGVLQGSLQVPATLGGGVPAYCRVQCCGFIQNTSGAALVTGIHTYADLRFDDLMVVLQNTAFDLTPVNTASTNLSTVNPLSQSGTSSTINVAATTYQFADGQVSYNSGTVNPGYGLWGVTADDPTFVGGAVSYAAQSTGAGTIANNGRQLFGDITTAASPGGATGSGGGTGGAGPKGKGQLGL